MNFVLLGNWQVEVTVSIVHPRLGDLTVSITSPKGTVGVLMKRPAHIINPDDPKDFGAEQANIDAWPYVSNRQWGEGINGAWTLTVEDGATGQTGTLTSWSVKFFGDEITADSLYVYNEDFAFANAEGAGVLQDTDGGTDTINTSPCRASAIVDLTAGSTGTSVVNGRNLLIKDGTVIENAFTGDGEDTLIGNAADNRLVSGRGDDTIVGSGGKDVIDGGPGVDTLDYGKRHQTPPPLHTVLHVDHTTPHTTYTFSLCGTIPGLLL